MGQLRRIFEFCYVYRNIAAWDNIITRLKPHDVNVRSISDFIHTTLGIHHAFSLKIMSFTASPDHLLWFVSCGT